jgi:branched-chain amino acid transport system permease protein
VVQDILAALSLGSLYALMALGIALVFGVMRLVNFAYGELLMIGGYVLLAVNDAPWPAYVALTIAVVCLAAVLMERVAFRPVRNGDPTTMLVTSFAVSIGLQSLAMIVEGSRSKSVDVLPGLSEPLDLLGARVSWHDVVTLTLTIGLVVGFGVFLRKATLGVQLRAAAEDFRMARLLGVRANRVIAASFAASGVFAAVASILLVAQTGALTPTMGLAPALIAFVATVVGGMGSLYGAAIGGALLGVTSVTLQQVLPVSATPYRDAFLFAIVIVILLLRPQGIAGSPALQERI